MPQEIEMRGHLTCRSCDRIGAFKTQGDIATVIEEIEGWTIYVGRYSTVELLPAEDATARQLLSHHRSSCDDCDPADFTGTCSWCDALIDDDFEPSIYMDGSDESVCYSCFEDNGFRCEDCSCTYHYNDAHIIDEDRTVCCGCIEDYSYCENCDHYTSHGNMRYADDIIDMLDSEGRDSELDDFDPSFEQLCCYCADDNDWPSANIPPLGSTGTRTYTPPVQFGILNYTYRPSPMMVYSAKEKESMYDFALRKSRVQVFGLEIEVESQVGTEDINARADLINKMEEGQLFYCKSDVSIRNGFEIVTHPGTFDYWMGPGKDILEGLFDNLKAAGYTSYMSGRCGLHIHTNKKPLTRLQIYNMARFIHDRTVTPNLRKMSGRTDQQLLGYSQLNLNDIYDTNTGRYGTPSPVDYAKQIRHSWRIGDRGRALNLANTDTVELRLFRGSLKIERHNAGLQFYNTLLEFANPTNGRLKATEKSHWLDYREFIEHYPQPKAVRQLKALLQEAGI